MANYYSRSPPPLQHPVPTHPAFIPEPPSTPSSPQGYQRYTSSPPGPHQQQQFTQSAYAQFQQPPAYLGQPHPQQPPLAPHEQQYGVPDFSAWGLDGATAQIGMQLGQNAVHAGQEYVQKNLGGLASVSALKHHFNVSNSYVIRKLQLLLFPWRHRPWTRKMRRSEQGQGEFQPPREDINAPDLYIPTMAFVTYILTATLQSGLQARFNPDIFGLSATKALVVVLFDFLFLKGGCYVLGIQTASSVFDLVAYGGYKFVGVITALLAGLLNPGRTIWTLIFLYAFLANAFFLLRSLRFVVLPDAAAAPAAVGTVSHAQRKRRTTFLLLVAVSQVVYMGWLVRV